MLALCHCALVALEKKRSQLKKRSNLDDGVDFRLAACQNALAASDLRLEPPFACLENERASLSAKYESASERTDAKCCATSGAAKSARSDLSVD